MIVKLVANTELTSDFYTRFGMTKLGERERDETAPWAEESDLLAEVAGRVCYDSFDLPNPATRTNAEYLTNIRRRQHFSVLEHASFTFHVSGVSRALLAELTRHRHLSFSVRSQRYCDERESNYVFPELLTQVSPDLQEALAHQFAASRHLYAQVVDELKEQGLKRKEAHDAARYVLPEGTCTEFYVTGNGRAWLEFLAKRDSDHAAAEIRELAQHVSAGLEKSAPGVFSSDSGTSVHS